MLPFGPAKKHLWGLAAGGPLSAWHEESFQKLDSHYRRDKCLQILAEWWSIRNHEDAITKRNWLHMEGHTREAIYFIQGGGLANAGEDLRGRIAYAREHEDEILQSGLLAWDLGRLVSVARWSYTGGLISQAEAWEWITSISPPLHDAYDSWETFGRGWMLGYRYWNNGKQADPGFAKKLDWLLNDSASPWKNVGWVLRI